MFNIPPEPDGLYSFFVMSVFLHFDCDGVLWYAFFGLSSLEFVDHLGASVYS